MKTIVKLLLIFSLIACSFSFFTRQNQDPIAKVQKKQFQKDATFNVTTVSAENNTTNTTTHNRTKLIYNQTEYNFTLQKLNHFDPLDNRTFTQRYWIIDQFYNYSSGPIIYYICGEWTCTGADGYPVFLAKKFNGMVITLEHRYYGDSQPFGEESMITANMKYLTIQNALEDLAFFLNWAKATELAGLNPNAPWFNIGGSYPGGLSAWFRSKYPYLTIGALASSAVVHPILDFYEFDQQVRTSTLKSGDWCPEGIVNVTQYVQTLLNDPEQNIKIKAAFQSSNLTDGIFMFYFSDIYAELVQYGQREYLCNDLIQNKTTQEMLSAVLNYSYNQNSMTYQEGYQMETANNQSVNINGAQRQWGYQCCTQVAWFQTAPAENSLRSAVCNLEAYQQYCSDYYGTEYQPKVNQTNLSLGGTQLQATNLIMVNGCEDPWQWASLRQSENDIFSYIVECDDCGHCVDLGTPQEDDPESLQFIHNYTESHLQQWISEYWQTQANIQPVQLITE